MRIRAFEQRDEPEVVALWRECGLVRPWNDPHRDIARKLEVQRELFLVGVDGEPGGGAVDGAVVATAMAGYDGHRGWVNYLAVAPGAQRRGLARALMDEVERMLLERGCPKVNLQVRDTNDDAIAFYAAIGYSADAAVSLGKRLIPDD